MNDVNPLHQPLPGGEWWQDYEQVFIGWGGRVKTTREHWNDRAVLCRKTTDDPTLMSPAQLRARERLWPAGWDERLGPEEDYE